MHTVSLGAMSVLFYRSFVSAVSVFIMVNLDSILMMSTKYSTMAKSALRVGM